MATKELNIIINGRDRTQQAFDGVEGRLRGLTRALAAVGAGAVVGAAFDNLVSQLTEAGNQVSQFERDITPLLSLGDNLSNIAELRQQVLDYSAAWGIARDAIADAMFQLQSGASNLSEAQRNELLQSAFELKAVYGGDVATALSGITKSFQIYGDQLESISSLQSKLALLSDKGVLTFSDVATELPDVASAARAVNAEFDELLASLIVATQRGGKTAATFTGVRNVFLRLNNAEKEGIALTGSFADKLEQLQQYDGKVLQRIFGDEALATASNLVNNVDELRAAMGGLANEAPDVGAALARSLDDPRRQFEAISAALKEIRANNQLLISDESLDSVKAYEAALTGIERFYADKPLLDALVPDFLRQISAGADIYLDGGRNAGEEFVTAAQQALQDGNVALAKAYEDSLRSLANRTSLESLLTTEGDERSVPNMLEAEADRLALNIQNAERYQDVMAEKNRQERERAEEASREATEALREQRERASQEVAAIYKTTGDEAFAAIQSAYDKLIETDDKAKRAQLLTIEVVSQKRAALASLYESSTGDRLAQIEAEISKLDRVSESLREQAEEQENLDRAARQRAAAEVYREIAVDLQFNVDQGDIDAEYQQAIANLNDEFFTRQIRLEAMLDADGLTEDGREAIQRLIDGLQDQFDEQAGRIKSDFRDLLPSEIFADAEQSYLQGLAAAGNEAAEAELERLAIREQYADAERELQRILDSQLATDQQRVEARRRIAELSEAEAAQLARIEAGRLERYVGSLQAPQVEIGRFLTGLQFQNDQGDELLRQQLRRMDQQIALLTRNASASERTADRLANAEQVYTAGRN